MRAMRDVVMLRENAGLEKVLSHLRKGNIEALKNQIRKIDAVLEDENLVGSLKGVFTLSADVRKQIESARRDVGVILRRLT